MDQSNFVRIRKEAPNGYFKLTGIKIISLRDAVVTNRRTLCVHSQDSTRLPLLIKHDGTQSIPAYITPRRDVTKEIKVFKQLTRYETLSRNEQLDPQ